MIGDMKVDELKAELDRQGIEYPSAAKKPELIELLKESE
ncbi:HeH/LEM domain-containing protein [Enterococcus casseliflavus]|nr:HeH/LEM domain-containing protein [Enterococcus casseliflavus]